MKTSENALYWKHAAHSAFDALWRSGLMTRSRAYEWLAWEMGVSMGNAHIAKFSISQCKELIQRAKRTNAICKRTRPNTR
jgi:hypothetical protein